MAFNTLNLAEIYGAADRANALRNQQEYQQYQIQRQMRDDQRQDAVRGAYKINPDGTLDRQGTYANLYAVDPMSALELQSKLTASDAAATKSKGEEKKLNLENMAATAKYLRDSGAGVNDQASYDAWKAEGQALGAQFVNSLPAQYDPGIVRQQLLTADQFITQSTPKYERVDLGGKIQVIDVNPVTNPSIKGTQFDKSLTPGEVLTDSRTRSEGAANRAVSIRGQNISATNAANSLAETQRHHGVQEAATTVDPQEIESVAQMIAEGRLPAPTGFASRSPKALAIMRRVSEINPTYDAKNYNTAKRAESDFSTGKAGNTVRSLNVAVSHLNSLQELADALNNKDMRTFNKAANFLATETGSPAVTSFDTAKKLVADEVVKAVVGAGGGVHDREEAARVIDAANSPAQLANSIKTYKELMRGQLDGFKLQYEQSTGKKDFDRFLSEDAKKELGHSKQPSTKPPKVGEIVDGHIYLGGNPADQKSWKKK
jgi:hypothetical protein